MGRPVLLAVDSEPDILTAMERDLSRRFAVDYRVVISDNSGAVLAELDADDDVAVAMAGQWLAETSGVDFLRACHQLYPAPSGCCSSPMEMPQVARQLCTPWRSGSSTTT
jgi:thioredoxin reductase (NADPH)